MLASMSVCPSQYDVELVGHIESAVLAGAHLRALPHVAEADVLPRLSRVAVALELAKTRLAESGVADALAVKKSRRWRQEDAPGAGKS